MTYRGASLSGVTAMFCIQNWPWGVPHIHIQSLVHPCTICWVRKHTHPSVRVLHVFRRKPKQASFPNTLQPLGAYSKRVRIKRWLPTILLISKAIFQLRESCDLIHTGTGAALPLLHKVASMLHNPIKSDTGWLVCINHSFEGLTRHGINPMVFQQSCVVIMASEWLCGLNSDVAVL